MTEQVVQAGDAQLAHPFVKQMVTQLRALDSYGTYDNWDDAKVLDPVILTKARRREIPVVGDPDETTIARLKAWYNAMATLIENESGLIAVPMVNLTHEGFGRAIITVGKLIVVDKTLRDVHRFGFENPEKLVAEMEKLISKALTMIEAHRTVAEI